MNFLRGVFSALHAMGLKVISFLAIIFPWLAPFALLLSLVGSVDANYNSLINTINGLASYVSAMPAASWLGQANRIVPISEILGMLAVLLSLRVAAMAVRFVKSWIPTVN